MEKLDLRAIPSRCPAGQGNARGIGHSRGRAGETAIGSAAAQRASGMPSAGEKCKGAPTDVYAHKTMYQLWARVTLVITSRFVETS